MAETAEQTMVALPWQQGEATGTLNLPASTKVLDLLSGIGYVPVLSREIIALEGCISSLTGSLP